MRGTKRVRIRFVFTVQHAGPHVKSQCAGIARYGSRPPASLPISHPPSSRPPARGGPIGINGSPCEGEAGQRPGVAPEAVTEAGVSARQATRKGWPYYIRPLHQRYERFV